MTDPTTPNTPPADEPARGTGGAPPPPPGGYQQAPPPQGGYQQPGNPGSRAESRAAGRPGELLDRFLARLIDHAILFAVNMVLVTFVIIGSLMGGSGGLFGGTNFLTGAVSAVLGAAIYLGYFAYLESSRGQTIGKMVLKLETRGANGGRPTMEEAVKRNIWVALTLLGIIPVIGGLLGSLAQLAAMIAIAVGINGDAAGRRGWHDKFAGTQVVKVG